MEEFLWMSLKSKDKYGTTEIKVDDLEYEEAKESILEHLKFVYQSKRITDLTIEIKYRSKEISRSFEKIDSKRAKDGIIEFLKYVYGVKGEIPETDPAKYKSFYKDKSWLSKYDLEDLTQMEKVFLLLKHDHETGWIKSQDLKEEYEIMYGERIKLSSISTYLARLYEKGNLERKGSRAQREYQLGTPSPARTVS